MTDDPSESFRRLIEGFAPHLVRMVRRKIRCSETVADIVQETLLAAWERRELLEAADRPEAVLCTIANRRVIDHYRRGATRHESAIDPAGLCERMVATAGEDTHEAEIRFLPEALRRLPANAQAALYFFYVWRLDLKTIAEIYRRPTGSVKSWLSSLRAALRRYSMHLHGFTGVANQADGSFILRPASAADTISYRHPMIPHVRTRSVPYSGTSSLDVYGSPESPAGTLPAIIFVTAIPDERCLFWFGVPSHRLDGYVSWAKAFAANGIVSITYAAPEPMDACREVVDFLHAHAEELGIDRNRIAVWACSDAATIGLDAMLRSRSPGYSPFRTLVTFYPVLVGNDLIIRRFTEDHSFDVFLVRAGDEAPYLSRLVDRFVYEYQEAGGHISQVCYDRGAHGFDFHDTDGRSAEYLAQAVEYVKEVVGA